MAPLFGRLAAFAAALLLILTPAAAGDASELHVELRSSSPAADGQVEGPVEEVVLTFTAAVQAVLSRIDVTGPEGERVPAGAVGRPSPEARDEIRVALEAPLGPGAYQVIWRTVAEDGHVAEGAFSFQVTGPEPVAEPPAGAGPPDAGAAQPEIPGVGTVPSGTAVRWLQLLGMILFLGAVASRFGVLPVLARGGALPGVRRRLRRGYAVVGWAGVLLLLLALPLRLYAQFWGGASPWTGGEIRAFLFGTAWGAGWFLHMGVVALAVFGLILAAPRGEDDRGWRVLGVAALLLPLVPALQGHAWGLEGVRAMAVSSLYLHVTGVGIWLGGILLLLLVGLPAIRAEAKRAAEEETQEEAVAHNPDPPLALLVNAFSRMVLPAVALFLVTGGLNSWLVTGGTLEAYLGTTYGRTLLLKLGFVLGILALGFYNWRKVRPSLLKNPDPGILRIPASVEAVLGIVVLLITAALVATPLP